VYLPQEELSACGYAPSEFEQCMRVQQHDGRFDQLMMQQLERVRQYYEDSLPLEQFLSRDARATSWAMMRIYRGLLEKISKRPRDVLTGRVRLNTFSKLHICMRANWKRALA
jgi:phytoene/squalene synthetase